MNTPILRARKDFSSVSTLSK